eukprot:2328626-Rhodomonas_salina.3
MQFPEEWDREHTTSNVPRACNERENNAAAELGQSSGKTTKNISASDLEMFATRAASSHVAVSPHLLHCIGDDIENISSRVLALLPHKAVMNTDPGSVAHQQKTQPVSQTVQRDPSLPSAVKKRKKNNKEGGAGMVTHANHASDGLEHTGAHVQIDESQKQGLERCDMRLELDTLLSRLPYKKMMQEMLPQNVDKVIPSVPYVSRIYEEGFMREPIHKHEEKCVMGEICECMFIDKNNPFIGVEFIVPGEKVSSTPQMCVLCSRATTQQLFYDIVFDNVSHNVLIQRYGNLHSVPNEYAKSAMLICPPNGPLHVMPVPIMSHQRNRYSVVRIGGVRYIRQHGVHFQ